MLRRITALSVMLPALALVGCEGASGWSGTVTDSAGIAIVQNPAEGVWGRRGQPELERTLDIGTATGDSNTEFGQIAAVDVDDQGRLYLLDAQAQHVKVFGPDGGFLRQVGGPGSGPGELGQGVTALMVGPGDTLLVPDLMQQRIVRFAPNGEAAGAVALPMQSGLALRWEKLPDGRLLQQSRAMNMGGAVPTGPSGDPLIVRDPSGAIIDTLMTLPAGQSFQMQGGEMQMRIFAAEPVWTVMSDGGVAYAMNSDYSINVYSPAGELQRIVRLPVERRPVTEADRKAMLDLIEKAMRQQMADAGAPPEMLERMMQQVLGSIQFAEQYPAFANIMGGPDGSLWVQHGRTADEFELSTNFDPQEIGAPRWDVFDADGRYLGLIEFPERFTPLRFKGNAIYGIERDELDVQHVVRLELPANWPAD